MSNTQRKARKRAGTPLIKAPKTGTPLEERIVPMHFDKRTSRNLQSNRYLKKLAGYKAIRDGVE